MVQTTKNDKINMINQEEKSYLKMISRMKNVLCLQKILPSAFSFVRSQISNYQIAEEIAQDVFIDFIEALRDFEQSSLKTFLFSIARHKIVDQN